MYTDKRGNVRKTMSHGGKGSAPRKNQNYDAYSENYDKIFSKDRKQKQERALREMVRLTEEMGLYEDDHPYAHYDKIK